MKEILRFSGLAIHARLPAYALAVAVTLATLGGHLALVPWFGDQPVPVLFVLPILLSAALGGAGPALAATVVVALGSVYFLLPPTYHLPAEKPLETRYWLILIFSGALISLLTRLRRRRMPGGSNPTQSDATLTAERRALRSFGLALALLVLVGVMSILSLSSLRGQTAWETHTQKVIGALHQVLSLATEVETSARGYVLTGQEDYLPPHLVAERAMPGALQDLRVMIVDDPDQQKHFAALAPLISLRLAQADALITLRREKGLGAVQQSPDLGPGKWLQDRIREQIAKMEATEHGLLRAWEDRARRLSVTARTIVIGGGALAFAFVALALFLMSQEFSGRHHVEAALHDAQLDLTAGQQAQTALAVSRDAMEQRVALRTAELGRANQNLSEEIAGHRRTEEALLAAKERTESVLAGMTDIYFVVGRDWHYSYANEAALRSIKQTTAVPGEKVLSQTPWELFPAMLGTDLERQFRRSMEERVATEFDFRHAAQDICWHYRVYPAADGIAVFASDVTEARRAVDRLRDSEQRFAGAFVHAPNGMALVSLDGRWLMVNQALCELVGYTEAELLVGTFQQITHPVDLAADLENVRRLVAGEIRSYQMEKRYVHARGHLVMVSLSVSLVRDDQGRPRYFISQVQDITERDRNEEMLRRRKDELRVLFDLMPALIWFKDTENRILRVNQRAADAAGFSAEEIEGKDSAEIYPEEAAKYLRDDREIIQSGTARLGIVETLRDAAGNERWVQTDKVPVRDKEGRVTGIVVMAQDITPRRHAEESLLRNQALLRMAGRLSRLGAWSADVLERKVTYSDEMCAIHEVPAGFTPTVEEALDFNTPESRGLAAQAFEACVRDGTPFDLELQIITARGRRVWVRSMGEAERNEAGVVQRVQGAYQDISERRRSAEALSKSEELFKQVVENIDEVFWMTDPVNNQILYVSPAFAEIWGRSCESFCADPRVLMESVHVEDRARVQKARDTKETRGDYDEIYRIIRTDGKMRWIHSRAFPIRNLTGEIHRVVGVAEDVTEYHNIEEQFRQTQKMEAIGTLAGGIAHDFNNILAAINGYTELSRMILQGNPLVHAHLGAVLQASSRAADLIRQILTFSRQQPLERKTVRLHSIVAECLALLRATLPSTIEIASTLAPDAPPVLADVTQIHQVLMNLGTNAWHAMKDRDGRLEVTLEKFNVDDAMVAANPRLRAGIFARISVGDNGGGMDQATQQRIFEPFFTTKPAGEGTGLGLAVVHGIMDSHDGAITVYSQPDKGTVFRLYFPAHGGEAVVPKIETDRGPSGHGERILVVDDEELLARLGQQTLVALGYEVESSTQPAAALAMVRANPDRFALVLLDQTMPGMTGLALATQISQIRPGIPLILMTGYSAGLTPERIEAAGIRQLLLKPMSVHSLGAAVRAALASGPPH